MDVACDHRSRMRKVIAAAWIVGSAAGVFTLCLLLFGCCILPFHGLLDHALPLCTQFAGILGGRDHHQTEATQPPPRSKTEPQVHVASLRARSCWSPPPSPLLSPAAHNRRALRSIRSLGALRVDDDVGLQTLFAAFLI